MKRLMNELLKKLPFGRGAKETGSRAATSGVHHSGMVRVKLSERGDVFCSGKQLPIDEFDRLLAAVRDGGGCVVYYRESPSKELTAEQRAVFERIPAARVAVMMGDQAPAEWGRLEWFEMDELPLRVRLGIVPNQPLLFIDNESTEAVYVLRRDAAGDAIETLLGQISFLISAHRLVETEPAAPQRAFSPEVDINTTSGFQLRFAFDSDVAWAAFYELDAIPNNVASFYRECRRFTLQLLATNPGSPLGPEDAKKLFSPDKKG
jgi:hypothetical protein